MTAARVDPLRIALQVGLYVFFFIIFLGILASLGVGQWLGLFAGSVVATFVPAVLTNLLTLRIYEGRRLSDIGLLHNAAAAWNLGMGFAGGVLSAALVLSAPLVTRAATMQSGIAAQRWAVRHHPSGWYFVRPPARIQPACIDHRTGQHGGFRSLVRICFSPQPRHVAAHWSSFRLEPNAPANRSQRHRDYNEIDGLPAELACRYTVERRRIWPRGEHSDVGGLVRIGGFRMEGARAQTTEPAAG